MNEEEIDMFIKSFDDFMEHADVEMQNYIRREAVRKYNQSYMEEKAAEMEVTVDSYTIARGREHVAPSVNHYKLIDKIKMYEDRLRYG